MTTSERHTVTYCHSKLTGNLTLRLIRLLLVVTSATTAARPAAASSNVIPGTTRTFPGTLGVVDRPFAGPNDVLSMRQNPSCSTPSPGFGATAADNVVTIVVAPSAGSSAHAAIFVLATDCAALESRRLDCASRPDVQSINCIQVNGGGEVPALEMADAGNELHIRLPDTDNLLAPGGDHRGLSGPAAIAVSGPGDALPCGLAATACSGQSGLIACVDDLYEVDGGCGAVPNATFSHFTVLPAPNDFKSLCSSPLTLCSNSGGDLHLAVDIAGNLLIPMNWQGIQVDPAVPVAQLLRGSSNIGAFSDSGAPVVLPGNGFLRGYSREGGLLPPLFDPQADHSTAGIALFGSVDAPSSVLRIARRSPTFQQCAAGVNSGLPCTADADCPTSTCGPATCAGGGGNCTSDADCPGAECGSSLFEFRGRNFSGVGPVRVTSAKYSLSVKEPVPLEGIYQTDVLNAFVVEEAVSNRDHNGDGDKIDHVIKMANRSTGNVEPIGSGGSEGRAVTRIRQATTTSPAVAVENDVLAFLEPEPVQGGVDANANGRAFETLLRVFRLGPVQTSPQTPLRAVDAAPLVDGRSLVVSGGNVFVRSIEGAMAAKQIVRASVNNANEEANGGITDIALSGNGRWLAFDTYYSGASNLVPNDTNNFCDATGFGAGSLNCSDIFVRDLLNGTTVRVSVAADGTQGNHASTVPSISYDGRFVAFSSTATNLIPGDPNAGTSGVFVYDRDFDGNGTFDETEPGRTNIERVSLASDPGDSLRSAGSLHNAAISADGRFVSFGARIFHDPPGVPGVHPDGSGAFVRDRLLGVTERVDLTTGGDIIANAGAGAISADGRFVAWEQGDDAWDAGDTNGRSDILVRDRLLHTTERVSITSDGSQSNGDSFHTTISGDGRYVAFSSWATNLVAGDTNSARDVFVRDRLKGTTERVSVSNSGAEGFGDSEAPRLSTDGRFVVFRSYNPNLVPNTVDDQREQIYVRDLLTGLIVRVTQAIGGGQGQGGDYYVVKQPEISADGQTIAFNSDAADLVAGDTNNFSDAFVYRPNPADPLAADLTGDLDLSDTVLEAVNATSGAVTELCPATAVATNGAQCVFLRPESAGQTPALASCPAGSGLLNGNPLLNNDGDANDNVVHLWRGSGNVENFHCAADAVAISNTSIAALVSEAGEGRDLNDDGDMNDSAVQTYALADAAPSDCDSGWKKANMAGDTIGLAGQSVVFISPESAQAVAAKADLNGDGDFLDRELVVFDPPSAIHIIAPAEEFVIGPTGLVAFRTSECSEGGSVMNGCPSGGTDLNGDGDAADDVLQVYDTISGLLYNTEQAATPCRQEACDPRQPYRVFDDTVKFLTLESEQGEDLNGNGTQTDLVLQVFNVRTAAPTAGPLRISAHRAFHRALHGKGASGLSSASLTAIGAVSAGICTTNGAGCVSDDDCGGGSCFVPPGDCVRLSGGVCSPSAQGSCGPNKFCEPIAGTSNGTCYEKTGTCSSNASCTGGAVCRSSAQNFKRLTAPMSSQVSGGAQLFVGAGQCVIVTTTSCSNDANCAAGQVCGSQSKCEIKSSPCRGDDDCSFGATCRKQLLSSSAADTDGDGIADPFDNCPSVPNIGQEDSDGDGVGDACDAYPHCGDGALDSGEVCDDGNHTSGDGCSPSCQVEVCWQCSGMPSMCNPTTGTSCDDGLFCNGADTCNSGVCQHAGNPCSGGSSCNHSCNESADNCAALLGTACADDGNMCTRDICDGAGSCSHPSAQRMTCKAPGTSKLSLKKGDSEDKDKLSWSWGKGAQTLADELGTPATSTKYAFCVFDQNGVVLSANMPNGANWVAKKATIAFKDKTGASNGIVGIKVAGGLDGKAKAGVKGKGTNLTMPATLGLSLPVTAQLVTDANKCWSATYSAGKADTTSFSAKTP